MALRASVLVAALFLLALPASAGAAAPWPCLYIEGESFFVPVEGRAHAFDASCSSDADGHDIVRYEWDLDGDGHFETNTGASPFHVHTFTGRGTFPDATVNFAWKVTDAAGESDSFSVPLRITDTINSWFRYAPELVNPGDELSLEAFTAHVDAPDPPNPLAPPPFVFDSSWDLDGDSVFETSSGLIPTTKLVAPPTVGRHPVSLRVSDGLGNTSTVKRNIEVLPRHPSRDTQPWDAPQNLGQATPTSVTENEVREAVAPVGPDMPAVEPGGAPAQPTPIRLRKIDGSRRGMKIVLSGPKRTRWHITVRLPAERAAGYGLPRKTVVFARGLVRFDGRGIGKANMRWTKGAYKVFRRVRYSLVDIVPRRA